MSRDGGYACSSPSGATLVCIDETSKQQVKRRAGRAAPRRPTRYDYEYERTASVPVHDVRRGRLAPRASHHRRTRVDGHMPAEVSMCTPTRRTRVVSETQTHKPAAPRSARRKKRDGANQGTTPKQAGPKASEPAAQRQGTTRRNTKNGKAREERKTGKKGKKKKKTR